MIPKERQSKFSDDNLIAILLDEELASDNNKLTRKVGDLA